jgi:hypothetical protein
LCGDDVRQPGESCDGRDLDNHSCVTLGQGEGTLACSADSKRFDVSRCQKTSATSNQPSTPSGRTCGNGVIDGTDACDGSELGGISCAAFGSSGALTCDADCNFDLTSCATVTSACAQGPSVCSSDGIAAHRCGFNAGVYDYGVRIPCNEGESCTNGECGGATCQTPEILFVVDRSDSVQGRFAWVKAGTDSFSSKNDKRLLQGLRLFPDGQCAAGEISTVKMRLGGLSGSIVGTATNGSSPIVRALDGVEGAFGDPAPSQAVVLITDGEESCDRKTALDEKAAGLAYLGIRVFPVGISAQVNRAALEALARGGGTGLPRYATNAAELEAKLNEIALVLRACSACIPSFAICDQQRAFACNATGTQITVDVTCANGCDASTKQCTHLGLGSSCATDTDCGCTAEVNSYNPSCSTLAHDLGFTYQLECRVVSGAKTCTLSCDTNSSNGCYSNFFGVLRAKGTCHSSGWCL